ncbi:MAG: zinc-binding dehydrogenase [Hyphomicrobiales bacterium]|nr:zinc-binding dehydrogenase [Hyphomicrobiales bacterium]
MKVMEITKPGGPGVLEVCERAMPEIDDGQVLIKVTAAGVNRPDCVQRAGFYPPPKGASDIPGLEISGKIVALGGSKCRFSIGDSVIALVTGGGYGEYVVADEGCILPVPSGLSMIEAAALPETFFTVWHNVFQRGGLVSGETLLVHGGSSGIGTTAIQLAKNFGAKVIITAGSAEKCEACQKLGADVAINYREQDFVEVVRENTANEGVDLILDMVGGDYVERNYQAAAIDGRIVQIALLQGATNTVNHMQLMLKRLTHTGSTLRARSVEFKSIIAGELEQQVWPLIEQGKIRPVIDRVFPLEHAAAAHERMESSTHIGKIMLDVNK